MITSSRLELALLLCGMALSGVASAKPDKNTSATAAFGSNDHEAIIRILSPTGRKLEGVDWVLYSYTDADGSGTTVTSGRLGPDATIRASHLKFEEGRYYSLFGARGALQATFRPKPTDDLLSATRQLAPQPGDFAPDIPLSDVMTSKSSSLMAFRGKVVVLDFWATWCPGCQPVTTKLNELANKRGADWQDNVALVSISCDDDVLTARNHIANRKWDSPWIHHLWFGTGEWAARAGPFALTGIPSVIVIDEQGRILFRGTGDTQIDLDKIEQLVDKASSSQNQARH